MRCLLSESMRLPCLPHDRPQSIRPSITNPPCSFESPRRNRRPAPNSYPVSPLLTTTILLGLQRLSQVVMSMAITSRVFHVFPVGHLGLRSAGDSAFCDCRPLDVPIVTVEGGRLSLELHMSTSVARHDLYCAIFPPLVSTIQ